MKDMKLWGAGLGAAAGYFIVGGQMATLLGALGGYWIAQEQEKKAAAQVPPPQPQPLLNAGMENVMASGWLSPADIEAGGAHQLSDTHGGNSTIPHLHPCGEGMIRTVGFPGTCVSADSQAGILAAEMRAKLGWSQQ